MFGGLEVPSTKKNVTLSSSEAEYVAISEVCTEIMFIKTILSFLGIEIKRPIQVNCDNIGAIFLAIMLKPAREPNTSTFDIISSGSTLLMG